MHTTNAYAYNTRTQQQQQNQTVNKKQQSINNWMTHTGNNHILHIIK